MIYVEGEFLSFGLRFISPKSSRLSSDRKQFLRQPRELKDVSILSSVKVVFVNGQELLPLLRRCFVCSIVRQMVNCPSSIISISQLEHLHHHNHRIVICSRSKYRLACGVALGLT